MMPLNVDKYVGLIFFGVSAIVIEQLIKKNV